MALKLVNTPEVQNSSTSTWLKWLGPCASIACLIHCFLLSVILLVAPSFYHSLHLEQFHNLELAFWAVALLLGIYTLNHASVDRRLVVLFVLVASPGPFAFAQHNHDVLHGVLSAMAIFQFSLVLFQHLRSKKAKDLECCHHHEHPQA